VAPWSLVFFRVVFIVPLEDVTACSHSETTTAAPCAKSEPRTNRLALSFDDFHDRLRFVLTELGS